MPTITIHVEGISALLLHNPAGMRPSEQQLGRKTIPTPEDEAEAGTYRLPNGQLYLPTPAFRSCLVSAGKGRRFGKTAATTIIKGAVFPSDEVTPLITPDGDPLHDYEIDMRRAVIQRAAVVRCRPKLPKWAADVHFDVDEEFISDTQVRELFAIGGRVVGVGDYRPEKAGPFGRFTVAGRG
jgi:hypothetical protein